MFFLVLILLVIALAVLFAVRKQNDISERTLMLNIEYRKQVCDEILEDVYNKWDKIISSNQKMLGAERTLDLANEALKRVYAQLKDPGSTYQSWKVNPQITFTRAEIKQTLDRDFRLAIQDYLPNHS